MALAALPEGSRTERVVGCLALFGLLLTIGCVGRPEGVVPVEGFELARYLGRWYEIARLDHPFERGLERVTAEYSLREDGGLRVVNRGFSVEDDEWKVAEGRAYFVDAETTGHLKVSFFGPFYGSYIVFELDRERYEYAFVSGPNTSYLWLLARSPEVDPALIERFRSRASELGFDTNALILVAQDGPQALGRGLDRVKHPGPGGNGGPGGDPAGPPPGCLPGSGSRAGQGADLPTRFDGPG